MTHVNFGYPSLAMSFYNIFSPNCCFACGQCDHILTDFVPDRCPELVETCISQEGLRIFLRVKIICRVASYDHILKINIFADQEKTTSIPLQCSGPGPGCEDSFQQISKKANFEKKKKKKKKKLKVIQT